MSLYTALYDGAAPTGVCENSDHCHKERYTATWSSSVDTPRVVINTMQVFKNHPNVINIIGVTATQFTVCTNELSGSGSPAADSVLEDTPLEIRIYPSTI